MPGFFASIVTVGLAVALVYYLNVQRMKQEDFVDYDERQLLVRGNAYRYGFSATVLYGVLYFLYSTAGGRPLMLDGVAVFLGLILGITTFATYSVVKGASFTKSSPMKTYLILYALIILSNALAAVGHIHAKDFIQDGLLADPVIFPAVGLAFLVIFIATLVANAREKKAAEADGEADDE